MVYKTAVLSSMNASVSKDCAGWGASDRVRGFSRWSTSPFPRYCCYQIYYPHWMLQSEYESREISREREMYCISVCIVMEIGCTIGSKAQPPPDSPFENMLILSSARIPDTRVAFLFRYVIIILRLNKSICGILTVKC